MYPTGPVPEWARHAPAYLSIARRVGKVTRWALRAPADRLTIPAAAVVWGTGAVLHSTGVPTLDVGLIGGVALPAVTYGVMLHRGHVHGQDNDHASWRAAKASFGMLMAGAWAATAARWGVFAGPEHLSSLIYGAGAGLGYALVRVDELTRMKRDWRNERTHWLSVAKLYGLNGSHLLSSETTRIGKRLTVDVTGTGRRASTIASRDTAERIAERRQLPPSRIQVTAARIAGRIHISIRDRDPWLHAIPHPLFDDAPEIELPESQSITEPLILGIDPETGRTLTLDAYDAEDFGARAISIISTRGGGKTVLLNDLMERLTACRDVLVWDINLSKAKENRRWAPACDLVAHGPHAKRDALTILRLARKAIEYRGNVDGDDAIHQPTPTAPAIVVRIDEMKTLLGGQSPIDQAIRNEFTKLNETGRSEGIVTIRAGQRNVITHTGSSDIRANDDTYLLAKVRNRSEMMYAAGDAGMELPDMTTYGDGYPGVWLIGTHGGEYATGRTFLLKDLPDITKVAESRPPTATLEPGLREYLGDAYERLKTGEATARTATDEPVIPGWMGDLAKELTGDMDADLFEQWEQIDALNAATARQLADLESQDLTELGPEHADALRAATAERMRQAVMTVDIPADRRQKILDRVKDGARMRDLVGHVGVGKTTMFGYLARLRFEGLVELRGKGAGSRWHLTDAGSQ